MIQFKSYWFSVADGEGEQKVKFFGAQDRGDPVRELLMYSTMQWEDFFDVLQRST